MITNTHFTPKKNIYCVWAPDGNPNQNQFGFEFGFGFRIYFYTFWYRKCKKNIENF